MGTDKRKYAHRLRTLAREAAMPQCCLYTPADECNPTPTVDGIEMASKSLSPDTLTALTTKYAGRVPADDVILRDVYATADYVEDSCLLGGLGIGHACNEYGLMFDMTLAHFAIDLTGDASTLTPTTEPPPHTFATVVYFFPSNCVGGAVTIAHEHRTTTFEALDGCFLSFYSTCDVTVAPITSGHRSFAVYYAAYHTSDDDVFTWNAPTPRFAPLPLPSIQELQRAAHHFDPQGYHGVAIGLETRGLTPTFDSLTGHDKAVVDLLLAADVFDIALVRAGENDESKGILSLIETFHPRCKTPALVQEVYHQTPINEFAADMDEIKSPGCFLLVWPKANRVRMLGYDRTLGLLHANVDGDVTEHLGYGSLQSIFEAAFRFFYPRPEHCFGRNPPPQSTYAMASLLYDYGDLHLIETFLDVHDQWADNETMANWIVTVVRRFGAPHFQHRLRKADVSISFGAQLVHLATAGDKLAQTIACDCIPVWWPRLLNKLSATDCAGKKKGLFYLFDIETYLLEHPIHMAASTHLRRRHLPDVLVRKVATYLTPPLASLLQTVRADKCLMSCLPAVVWSRQDSLCSERLAKCIDLAVEYLRSGDERASCYKGHVLYLALLTAGTPAYAVVDADMQTWRHCFDFKGACTGVDKRPSSTAMDMPFLEEYMHEDDEEI
ncbi:hypothetical protein SPRG_14513 [Saprolegnia parasitica CBS 223.65]|uniref:Uncharacterized protein n=1 Tax=Saprolegnia parasitica (strain CBS 223.65) TaxID=695850 RepID=A0A067BTP2_SAPPC|nr:hypothetical protein SPRG_14513 [Saprolegnia parasitica CBS 223.65]KDO20165.1 hypothetical protein SPRG_14513 [Saprolegnia parasitica CBS 223.65]|eukprot:XP_012209114.1 hypothetical protein SPRG_14513 [Saprolegnia parasitica CBS 223.65]